MFFLFFLVFFCFFIWREAYNHCNNMRINEGFVLRDICGRKVIMAEGLGTIDFSKMVALNKSAAWLWQQAQEMGDFTIEALTEKLCDKYDVTPEEARQDVAEIIGEWQKLNVVE